MQGRHSNMRLMRLERRHPWLQTPRLSAASELTYLETRSALSCFALMQAVMPAFQSVDDCLV